MKRKHSIIAAMLACGILFNACKKDENPAKGELNSLAALFVVKKAYKGSDVKLTPDVLGGATMSSGVVISDPSGKNFPKGALIVQNSSRGQVAGMLFDLGDTDPSFVPGDSVVVDLNGATLTKVGKSLQIKGLTTDKIKKISSNNTVLERAVSMGVLATNFPMYEHTLVRVTADTKPLPATGETYAGSKTLDDGSGSPFALLTQGGAAFAANALPASATYAVIPVYGAADGGYGETEQLRLRTEKDVTNASGPIYPGWPESFETPDLSVKGSYNMNTPEIPNNRVNLKTGNWTLYQSILANTAGRDRFNAPGLQAIRFQQNLSESAYLQMNFDLPNGASKVTLWHGAYYTDAVSTFRLEYSTDQGATWLPAGPDIQTKSNGSKQETFLMNIKGNVRFRVNKLGLGPTSVPKVYNGRLSIEDIAIFSN